MDSLEQIHNIVSPVVEDIQYWLERNSEYERVVIDEKGAHAVRKFCEVPTVSKKPPVRADGKRA